MTRAAEAGRPARFELPVHVGESDIDGQGHVNNLVYLRWVQEVASAHWRHAASPEHQASTVWVVVRHEIDYRAPALEGDELLARTWVEVWKGATSHRHTEIVREGDGEVLAKARTVWCALDAASRRPKRVAPEVRDAFLETPGEPGSPW